MPFPIGNMPRGLLSLLNSKSMGRTPPAFGDLVAPVVELLELYGVNQQVGYGYTVNPLVAGGNFTTTGAVTNVVPAGEVWRLVSYSTIVISGAGETGEFAPCFRQDGVTHYLADAVSYAANQFRINAWDRGTPILLPAGAALGIWSAQQVGAAQIGGLQAVVQRLTA